MNAKYCSEPIDPAKLYTPRLLAQFLEVDVQWVKKNLISTRQIRFRKQGNVYVIVGKWFIEWAESDHSGVDHE